MSFVVVAPDTVAAAAQDLAGIHSTLSQASEAAAGPTAGVAAAAQDQVSASVARFFGSFGQEYQAISAQTQAFHQQFVNLLNAGAGAYLNTEAANARQALTSAVNAPAQTLLGAENAAAGAAASQNAQLSSIAGAAASAGSIAAPYESLLANTSANLQGIGTTWAGVTAPAVMQMLTTQFGTPQSLLSALQAGNLSPLLTIPAKLATGSASVLQAMTVPISLSVTSLTSTHASVALGAGLPELLAFDALGAPVNGALAMKASSTAFFAALQAGNTGAAVTTVVDAPANVANGFLNGGVVLPVRLPLPGMSVTADVPFGGLLAPVEPFSATVMMPGSPMLQSVTITGPPVGGLIPGLMESAPLLLTSAFAG